MRTTERRSRAFSTVRATNKIVPKRSARAARRGRLSFGRSARIQLLRTTGAISVTNPPMKKIYQLLSYTRLDRLLFAKGAVQGDVRPCVANGSRPAAPPATRRAGHRLALAFLITFAAPAGAQYEAAIGDEPLIVDPMASARDAMARGDPAEALARYLRVLARDPADLEALSGAGGAALAVGDADAAINFFVRAEKIAPRDGQIKAGLGSALVQKRQPRAALRLFGDAVDLGVAPFEVALDRGLAYDLRGDNKKAQAEYLLALRAKPSNAEATRRLALSLAIGGDGTGALAILDPLLRKKDVAAWRARAFILAITGDAAGAESAAYALLPRYQADALKPFLKRIPSLKATEKAAAVHFGAFPEDKVPQELVARQAPLSKAAPIPLGPPSSTATRPEVTKEGQLLLRADNPSAKAGSAPLRTDRIVGERAADTERRAADERSLAQDRRAAQKQAAAEKAAAEKKARAKDETNERRSNPERYWVQIASGAYKPDLDKEWDKQKSRFAKQLSGRTPWTTPYKGTNRLLIGPFASKGAAQDYVNDARTAGFSCFPVTTSAGQKVERVN